MKQNGYFCDCGVIHAETVSKVRKKMLPDGRLRELSGFFKVFGDGTRVKIMWALDQSEMCVCDLAVLLNLTKSAVSHQLRLLREKRLVKYRRQGKIIFYSLADHHIKQILETGLEHIGESRPG